VHLVICACYYIYYYMSYYVSYIERGYITYYILYTILHYIAPLSLCSCIYRRALSLWALSLSFSLDGYAEYYAVHGVS
jgi:hypothetical protein